MAILYRTRLRTEVLRVVPFILLAVVLLLPLAFVALLPLSIVQRYRVGTARRLGRSWVATLNVVIIGFSAVLFILATAVMSAWVPETFLYAVAGFAGGGMLGLLGLKLTRWEPTARAMHYTPNRVLVLIITLAVTARVLHGFWRAWQAWDAAESSASWLAASGAAGSLAVGAVVLGYYLTYWAGVARHLKRHRNPTSGGVTRPD